MTKLQKMSIFAQLNTTKMRRFTTLILSLLLGVTAFAQSPEAVLESIRKQPNLAVTVGATYPTTVSKIATAPKGFEPFYLSMVGRHGSRYEQNGKNEKVALAIYRKADSLGILTEAGKRAYAKIAESNKIQNGHYGELTPLGYEQWRNIGQRAHKNFGAIFEGGTVEAKASIRMRCVLSMVAFNQGLKECNPKIGICQDSRESDLPIIRPLYDNPDVPASAKAIHHNYRNTGAWLKAREEWERSRNCDAFLSKITTDKERLLTECGAKYPLRIARYTYRTLIFTENFEVDNRELVNLLFTPEELYDIYVYSTAQWMNNAVGRGNEVVEMFASYMLPMVDDILDKANEAVEGKNPYCANLRFTHDTYVTPLLSVIGYEGCVPQWSEDIEKATTSFNHGEKVPMASNLQIVLYRNKKGEILVRSLINERDAYLPIECKTAPFYPWNDFCNHITKSMEELIKTRKKLLKEFSKE